MKRIKKPIAWIVILTLLCTTHSVQSSLITSRPAQAEETVEAVKGTPNYNASQQYTGSDDDFRVGISYVTKTWKEQCMADFSTEKAMQITGVGDYKISYTTAITDDLLMMWLDTNLYSGSKLQVDVTGVTITSADGTQTREYSLANGKLAQPGSLWGYRDSNSDKNYAATFLNPYLTYHFYVTDYCNNYRPEYEQYGFDQWSGIDLFSEEVGKIYAGDKIEVSFTVSKVKPAAKPTPKPYEPGEYIDKKLWAQKGIHAYLSYQMADSWDYRNVYSMDTTTSNTNYGYIKANGIEANPATTKVQDVWINRDGEYTVSISGIDLSLSKSFNILQVATDISVLSENNPTGSYSGIEVTNVSLKIDGENVAENLTVPQLENEKFGSYALISIWENTGPLFEQNRLKKIPIPKDSIEITFTISGLKAALNDLKNGTYLEPLSGKNVMNAAITQEDVDASAGTIPIPSPSEEPGVTPAPQKTATPAPTKKTTTPKKTSKPKKSSKNTTSKASVSSKKTWVTPKIKAVSGRIGATRYVTIRLNRYSGTNVMIYYRTKKGKWARLPITSSSIKRNKGKFRIRCNSVKKTYYFRVKTYKKQNGNTRKSGYSNVAKVYIK